MTGWGSYGSNGTVRVVDPSTTTGPDWIENLYSDSLGNSTAANHRNQILAEAIPALSLPVGANETSKFDDYGTRNFNMPSLYADKNQWPNGTTTQGGVAVPNWHHSNMREVAYPYLFTFYDQLVYISTH
jgi:hypothetical protein